MAAVEESVCYDNLDYSRVNMMLKKEVNIIPLESMKLPGKARAIQYCTNLRSAYELATEQTSLCHALAEATDTELAFEGVQVHIRYTAEMSPEQLGLFATESENMRAAYHDSFLDERDGKNWDANVQIDHRKALVGWYHLICPQLAHQARAQICVTGRYSKRGVRVAYKVCGTVKSGHWDTSSGNAALNIEITVQAIVTLPERLRPVRVRGLVMGDDLLLWLYFDHDVDPREYAAAVNGAERRLGINPVRGIFKDILNVSFCSMGFYHTSQGVLVALPKIGRCFAKLFWTTTAMQGRDPRRIASTIAHAFYPAYVQYEPMRLFLKHHMRFPPIECDISGSLPYVLREWQLPRIHGICWAEGNAVKYGIPPDALSDMAEILQECPSGVVHHPLIDRILEQDLSDPPDRRGVLG